MLKKGKKVKKVNRARAWGRPRRLLAFGKTD